MPKILKIIPFTLLPLLSVAFPIFLIHTEDFLLAAIAMAPMLVMRGIEDALGLPLNLPMSVYWAINVTAWFCFPLVFLGVARWLLKSNKPAFAFVARAFRIAGYIGTCLLALYLVGYATIRVQGCVTFHTVNGRTRSEPPVRMVPQFNPSWLEIFYPVAHFEGVYWYMEPPQQSDGVSRN